MDGLRCQLTSYCSDPSDPRNLVGYTNISREMNFKQDSLRACKGLDRNALLEGSSVVCGQILPGSSSSARMILLYAEQRAEWAEFWILEMACTRTILSSWSSGIDRPCGSLKCGDSVFTLMHYITLAPPPLVHGEFVVLFRVLLTPMSLHPRALGYFVAVVTLAVLTTAILCLRFLARSRSRARVGADDYWIFFSTLVMYGLLVESGIGMLVQ